jgi:hypothetical protein
LVGRSKLPAVIATGDLAKGDTMKLQAKVIVTVAVAAALIVPAAQAKHADDRAGIRGPGLVATPQQQPSAAVRPDDRAGIRGPGAPTASVVASTTSNGFDWDDALIGGAGGMGAAFLLIGCTFLALSQRHRARTA